MWGQYKRGLFILPAHSDHKVWGECLMSVPGARKADLYRTVSLNSCAPNALTDCDEEPRELLNPGGAVAVWAMSYTVDIRLLVP